MDKSHVAFIYRKPTQDGTAQPEMEESRELS